MRLGTLRRDHVSTYLLLKALNTPPRDLYSLICSPSCLLADISSKNSSRVNFPSGSQFFIMRSERVGPHELWTRRNSTSQICGQTLSWFCLSAYARRCWAKVIRTLDVRINSEEETQNWYLCLIIYSSMHNVFRIDVVDGISNWEVSETEGRGWEAE